MKETKKRSFLRAYIVDDTKARVFLIVPDAGMTPIGWLKFKTKGKFEDEELEQYYHDNVSEIAKQEYLLKENI